MSRYVMVMFAIASASLLHSGAFSQAIPDSVSEQLKKAVEEFKTKVHSPGIAVAIVKDDEVVFSFASGYTDADKKITATTDSRFPVMSVTKVFTATMLMQLAEKGIVNLQDPVKKFVPEYKVSSRFKGYDPTTLYQLGTHTSGLPRNTPAQIHYQMAYDSWMLGKRNENLMRQLPSNRKLLESLAYVELAHPPYDYVHHNDRHYSNLGYSLLGIALERAAKISYANYVDRYIFKPLQMQRSGFLSDEKDHEDVATGYRHLTSSDEVEKLPMFRPGSALYAGGIYSTANDLAKFLIAHYGTGPQILEPQSLGMMRTLRIGWKPAFPYVLHEGSMPGYRSIIVIQPEAKTGWVILCNVHDADFNSLNEKFAVFTSNFFAGKNNTSPRKFAGTYSLGKRLNALDIIFEGDSLYSNYLDDILGKVPLKQERPLTFSNKTNTGHPIQYEFIVGQKGEVEGLKMGQFFWKKEK